MRARLLGLLVVLLVVSGVLLVVPALESVSRQRTTQLTLERRVAIERIVGLARLAVEDGDAAPLQRHVGRYHELFGEEVLVVGADGEPVAGTGGLDPAAEDVRLRIRDFGFNLPDLQLPLVLPWGAATSVISAPVEVDRNLAGGVVLLEVDLRPARADVRRSWLLVLGAAGLVLGLLVAATTWATRWILRPVAELDGATTALASGEPVPGLLAGGPPELRRLARSFRSMADTLSTTLGQQRELVANTSHQLRNPLAAVRLQVDLLGDDPASRPAVEAIQRDLDRLDATVDRLLALAEAEHRATAARASHIGAEEHAGATPARHLVEHVRTHWSAPGEARVEMLVDDDLVVGVSEHDLLEMTDALLENARKYAGPEALVRVAARRSGDGRVAMVVDDDGPGLDDDELTEVGTRFWRSSRHAAFPGTGLGLALVVALAEAAGGSADLGRSERGGLAVRLDLPEATS